MLTRLIKLSDNTGIARTSANTGRWEWIEEAIADEFRCYRDDIDSTEQEDGSEWITVRGEPVARIEYLWGWRAA